MVVFGTRREGIPVGRTEEDNKSITKAGQRANKFPERPIVHTRLAIQQDYRGDLACSIRRREAPPTLVETDMADGPAGQGVWRRRVA